MALSTDFEISDIRFYLPGCIVHQVAAVKTEQVALLRLSKPDPPSDRCAIIKTAQNEYRILA